MTVRDNICIAALKYAWIWVACVVLALVSCTNDSIKDIAETGVTLYPAIAGRVETVVDTRAAFPVQETTDTYDDALIPNGTVIRAYAVETTGASTFNAGGSFRYSNGWRSSVTVENDHKYNIYAFTPVTMPGAANQTFNYGITKDGDNHDVFDLNTTAVTFTGLDILTTTDPMVCVAAAGRPATLNAAGNEIDDQGQEIETVVPTVTKGDYCIGTVKADPDNRKYQKVWMAMDHLYAKATLSFCIDPTYHEIRDIRLKEATVTVTNGTLSGNHTYSFKDGLLLATNSAFGTKDLAIDLMTGPTARENRDAGKDYATLTEDYKEYAWFCFLPTSYVPLLTYPKVTLKVKYDVFDRHDNEVRLNQTAQNELSLNYFIRDDNANITPKPADHFKIKVKIKPSYLHQLIDDDAEITLDITNQD